MLAQLFRRVVPGLFCLRSKLQSSKPPQGLVEAKLGSVCREASALAQDTAGKLVKSSSALVISHAIQPGAVCVTARAL